jgi:hypothetical protein
MRGAALKGSEVPGKTEVGLVLIRVNWCGNAPATGRRRAGTCGLAA